MIKQHTTAALLALLIALFVTAKSHAQFPAPEIYSISPPAIEAGKTTGISLSGANLDDLTGLTFSAPGLTAKPVMLPATEFRPKPGQNGSMFLVTAPEFTNTTTVEIRAAGYFGLSTSRPILVIPAGQPLVADKAGAAHHQLETAPELPRETLAYGNTDADQTDWWKVTMKKDERVLFHCRAERIESQADISLKLVDNRGYELETDRDTIGRDPMIDFIAPADGDYWIGAHDVFYRGGTHYTYTLKASAAPWIDTVIPPAGVPGTTYRATLIGRNLPGSSRGEEVALDGKPLETLSVEIKVPEKAPEMEFSTAAPATALLPGFTFRLGQSNPVKLGFSSSPVIISHENVEPPLLTIPSEVSAQFDSKEDTDHFSFSAKKGTAYWIEVIADRIGDDSDPFLLVEKVSIDKDGKESVKTVRESDDFSNSGGSTFDSGSHDTALGFTADEDADYRITVINQFNSGSPVNTYRLQLRTAKPDFNVIAVTERPYLDQRQAFPAAPLLRQGGTAPLRLLVQRKDGFTGPILVKAEGLPEGVTCPEVSLQNLETSAYLTLAATGKAPAWTGNIKVTATATIGEKTITHPVRAGTITLGNNDYNLARIKSRLSPEFPLAVSAKEVTPVRIEVEGSRKFSVTQGQKLSIPFKLVSRHELKGSLSVTPVGLYGLKKPPVVTVAEDKSEGTFNLNFAPQTNVFDVKAGTWNFILKGTGVTKYKRNPDAADHAKKELAHIEGLAKKYTTEAAATRNSVEEKKKSLAAATANLATATAEAKPAVEKSIEQAKADLASAEKALATAESNGARAGKELTAAKARSTALTKSAAQKDVKFATWSLPLSVEILPEEKKK
ncbi:hypothetical protein VSU19_15380 [Verrucomicrobiales bacterium BCK34]|nr:hypothetical protein [Verrucomicrobiales bacterium BCK34]